MRGYQSPTRGNSGSSWSRMLLKVEAGWSIRPSRTLFKHSVHSLSPMGHYMIVSPFGLVASVLYLGVRKF